MNQFDLDHQYSLYLKRSGLKEAEMHEVQRTETKRAFFGACGQMLLLLRDDLGGMEDEDRAVATMHDMVIQCEQFWKDQLGIKTVMK